MNLKDFLHNLTEEYGTAEFIYNSKTCGIEPETKDSVTTFCMWYGDKWKDYATIADLIADEFFDGRCLIDILSEVDVTF